MKANLKKFLTSLKESDFKGASTAPEIKAKAESFLNSNAYRYNESYKKADITGAVGDYDIHNSLLCLIYDQI